MNKEPLNNVRLGVFVVTGVMLLIIGLYFIGNNKNMFGKTFRLSTTFTDVSGLTEGNNVRYSGIDVGTVDHIEIINDTVIYVEMIIDDRLLKFIRKNSIASIGTDGLMGNKLVNISAGSPDAKIVTESDTLQSIKGINTEEMLRTLEFTNQNVAFISSNLKEITGNINRSRGTLYTVLMDTTLALNFRGTLANIENVSANLSTISEKLNSLVDDARYGKGLMATIVSDSSMSDDFKKSIQKVKEGSEQFSAIALEINKLVTQINNGNGSASVILHDSSMANDLKQSISNINSASKKLDEDLEGLKQSFLLKGYYKDQEKQKKKAEKNK